MEGRITDIGPRHFEEFYPPVIKKNKGEWDYHEIVKPGVLKHVALSGDVVYTVRCGGARLMGITTVSAALRRHSRMHSQGTSSGASSRPQ